MRGCRMVADGCRMLGDGRRRVEGGWWMLAGGRRMLVGGCRPPSVAAEEVAGVDFLPHVVEALVVAVGDDGLRLPLELREVVDDA